MKREYDALLSYGEQPALCPKCGAAGTVWKTTYVSERWYVLPESKSPYTLPLPYFNPRPEHLACACTRCGYVVRTKTKDDAP